VFCREALSLVFDLQRRPLQIYLYGSSGSYLGLGTHFLGAEFESAAFGPPFATALDRVQVVLHDVVGGLLGSMEVALRLTALGEVLRAGLRDPKAPLGKEPTKFPTEPESLETRFTFRDITNALPLLTGIMFLP
jgi:hypothetical protein